MRNIHVRTTFPLDRSSRHMVNFFQYGTYNLIPAWTLLGGSATFTICSTTVCLCKSEAFLFWGFYWGKPKQLHGRKQTSFTAHSQSVGACSVFSISVCNQVDPDNEETLWQTFTIFLSPFHTLQTLLHCYKTYVSHTYIYTLYHLKLVECNSQLLKYFSRSIKQNEIVR